MATNTSSSATSSLYSSSTSLPVSTNQAPNSTIPTSKSKPKTKASGSNSRKVSAASGVGRERRKVKVFTKEMQDMQARGKDPLGSRDRERAVAVDEEDHYGEKIWGYYERETYERRRKMEGGAFAMDNPEIIMFHSIQRGESIPNTRYYFQKMMCGFFDPNDPDDALMERPQGEERERIEAKAKPLAREWDRQGRDWGSGYEPGSNL